MSNPLIIQTTEEMQTWRKQLPQNASIGFVPTMGYLHIGHGALLERARAENDYCVLSIFVNPTQFNQQADFINYPKNHANDIALATEIGVDVIFMPENDAMYPNGVPMLIHETIENNRMEGSARPGHFAGMLTVVLKLLLLVQATQTYFGEKDYQQLSLVQSLVETFFVQTKVIGCETIRLPSGLPFSSRNARLSTAESQLADAFAKIIRQNKPIPKIIDELISRDIRVDYVEDHDNRRFAAVWIGTVRLIDNFKK